MNSGSIQHTVETGPSLPDSQRRRFWGNGQFQLALSTCLSDYRWYPEVKLTVMPNFSTKLEYWGELCASVANNVFPDAKVQNTWLKSSSTVMKAVGNLGRGIRCSDLENLSVITTMIVLFLGAVYDKIHCQMKCHYGVDRGKVFVLGKVWWTLAFAQAELDETNWRMPADLLGCQYLAHSRWYGLCV